MMWTKKNVLAGVGACLLLAGLSCLTAGPANARKQISVFDREANAGMFVRLALPLTAGGLVILLVSFVVKEP